MDQRNKAIALMLWQGREMVGLHSEFLQQLKVSCVRATLEKKPLDLPTLANRIDMLEAACDQVLQRTAIPVPTTNSSPPAQ